MRDFSFLFPFHPFALLSQTTPFYKRFVLQTELHFTSSLTHTLVLTRLLYPHTIPSHPPYKLLCLPTTLLSFDTPTFIMAYQQSYYQTTSLPMAVPHKGQQYYNPQNHGFSVSPPEVPESVTTGSGMGNSAYSATSSSYAGSASGEYDSTSSANGVDMQEYMQDRFSSTFDPLPLDRTLAVQTQT